MPFRRGWRVALPRLTSVADRDATHLFRCLWAGQLISNLGTQTSLYGIGLWLFAQSGRLLDFGLVALVVQLARLLAVPLLTPHLQRWSSARVMLVCHGVGAFCTLMLTWVLVVAPQQASQPPALLPILVVQGVAAMAEATLVLRFSSLIPLLIADGPTLIRANGLFATTDGLVVTMAPFLGTWVVSALGLGGVLGLDAFSFVMAMALVLVAPWHAGLVHQRSLSTPAVPMGWRSWPGRILRFWRRRPQARQAMLLSAVVMGAYAGCEILFPAWVTEGWGPDRMALALLLGCAGYGGGFLAWRAGLGRHWRLSGSVLLLLQALILIGAGIPVLAQTDGLWCAGVLGFSLGLPVVTAALHQAWITLAQLEEPTRVFALRYSCEWSSRLLAFVMVSMLTDRVLRPHLAEQLAAVPGQALALTMSGLGLLVVVALLMERILSPNQI